MNSIAFGRRALAGGALSLGLARSARAQSWPERPVRIIVAFSPGGEPDILMRGMQPLMQEALGQPVVIDNRPGASTQIGAEAVAQARPDGYTLLMTSSTTFAVNPHLRPDLPYRLSQFRPITQLLQAQLALYANPRLPIRTVAELIEYARRRPNGVTYTTTLRGGVAHLAGERMKQLTGLQMTDVPFRASTAAAQAIIRGDVDVGFDGLATYLGLVRGGEIRALAVTGTRRTEALPDVPTFAETGYPDLAQGYWYGLFAPAGTPDAAVTRILAAVQAASRNEHLRSIWAAQGSTLDSMDPDTFQTLLATESARWGALIRGIGLKLD
ncbi:MAG: tripartite tricarboxylate transporter substrate binding protein [Roseomonas sp.]|nr:tripartite tricarboxylate transporter substrate binding protein [Roseomonas sp.]MBX9700364.1 tripartite tricarboxylate transporter substrate binding protein [Acetobacteraceae bacterium]